jgi:transcriptional regulator with XRE-family HTH domain
MKERIFEFLRMENKTSAQFAEEIGVQPSGISHILSGRNNPSLDFIIKMLEKYSFLSTDWLLFGKGSMYKEPKMAGLFDQIDLIETEKPVQKVLITKNSETPDREKQDKSGILSSAMTGTESNLVKKIVWFYENNSFEEFYPTKK